jgi:hypothetical protein
LLFLFSLNKNSYFCSTTNLIDMDIAQLLQLVQTVNEKYNQIIENAKKINELIAQGVFEPTSLIAVWNPETSQTEKVELQTIIDQIIEGNNALVNQLISIGEIIIDGNDITIPSGVNWVIAGIPYFTTDDFTFTIPFASTDNTRIDIIVADTNGELIRYNGTETLGIAVRPNIPLNTVLVTQINVTDASFDAVDYGLSHNELAAIHGANSPSASNPFATMDDVGSGGGGGLSFHVNAAAFPATGNTTTLYIDKSNEQIYRWNGVGYVAQDYQSLKEALIKGDSFTGSNGYIQIAKEGGFIQIQNADGSKDLQLGEDLLQVVNSDTGGYGTYSSSGIYVADSSGQLIVLTDGTFVIKNLIVDQTLLTAPRTRIEPDKPGTYAMTDDLPTDADFVPYSGAINQLDLGDKAIAASSVVTQTNGPTKKMVLNSTNVTSDRTAEWQDKDYAGIADINDVTAAEASAKSYADGLVASLLDLRGNYNASGNTYPSSGGSGTAGVILKGDFWYISVAGTLGGVAVNVGDSIYALVDSPGTTSSNWAVLDANLSYVAEDSSNKTNTVVGNEANTTKYLSVKGFYDYLIGMTWLTNSIFGTWMFGNTAKTTAVDADSLLISDSADSNKSKKLTLANLVTYLQNSFATKSMGAYKFRVNNTNATADATETNFKSIAKTTLSTTPTFTAGTAPSGSTDHSYSGQHVGSTFYGKIDLIFGTAGATVQQVVVPLPSDWPTPVKPNSLTAASERIVTGVGFSATTTTGVGQAQYVCILRANAANNGFELVLSQASASSRYFHLTITYPTA